MKRNELQQYIGNQAQIGGSRHYVLTDGLGRNLRCIDVNSGSGLQYTILPDRGMDISLASFKGTNLVYLTCNGETHPSYYEPKNIGWLRTFTGGLLTTCGLTYLGSPVIDEGEELGLHGRYSTIPARQVADLSEWIDGEYIIKVRGTVEEGNIFGNKMRLEREITTIKGHNRISIKDKVTNFGYKPSPYMILYHMNMGYPLLNEDAELIIDPVETNPRNSAAENCLREYKKFLKPQANYQEQVFCHTMKASSNGETSATLQNHKLGIALSIKFNTHQLPYLIQWKMMGKGEYVLGLEPSNVPGKNRKDLRDENILTYLEPGNSITNHLEVFLSDISSCIYRIFILILHLFTFMRRWQYLNVIINVRATMLQAADILIKKYPGKFSLQDLDQHIFDLLFVFKIKLLEIQYSGLVVTSYVSWGPKIVYQGQLNC